MKLLSIILGLTFLPITLCLGQTGELPKNLSQAILFLNNDVSDSLKLIIKETAESDLKKISYPWDGNYKTVYNWTNQKSKGVSKYLGKKGIFSHQETVILAAFKQFLLEGKMRESELLRPYQKIEQQWAREDKARFVTDSLRGVYIPKDLEDCFNQINKFWSDSTKSKVKQWSEDEFVGKVHLGFGMWMRNNWQLWAGSRLSKYFNEKGIYHPEDMSGIILVSYHRTLNNQPLKLDDQIIYYINYWAKAEKEELERKRSEFMEYIVGDTVTFLYRQGFSSKGQENKYDNDSCLVTGEIIGLNNKDFLVQIKLLKSCDKKGIIYYDSEDSMVFNKKTRRLEKPKKRIVFYMKAGQEKWFDYADWEIE